MKKQIKKKLILNKETIVKLSNAEMGALGGAASLVLICTESCSLVIWCCTPTTNKMMAEQDQG